MERFLREPRREMGRHRRRRPRPEMPIVGLLGALFGIALIAFSLESHTGARTRSSALTVVTRQGMGQVVFEVYEKAGTSWWPWSTPRAGEMASLRVSGWVDGTALWEIETSKPHPVAVTYGQVPHGFSQTIPATGVAPALQPGGWYGVTVRGRGGAAGATFNARVGSVGQASAFR